MLYMGLTPQDVDFETLYRPCACCCGGEGRLGKVTPLVLFLDRTDLLPIDRLFPLIISAFARIENHYFFNDAFMRDGQLLESQEIDKMLGTSHLYPSMRD